MAFKTTIFYLQQIDGSAIAIMGVYDNKNISIILASFWGRTLYL